MCIRECLCWRDMKSPTIFAGTLTLTTSLVQILVTVAVFVGVITITHRSSFDDLPDEPSRVVAKLYIALSVIDSFVIIFSCILLVEVERGGGWRFCMVPWMIWIPIYILYECAINIYFFYVLFNDTTFYFYKSKWPFIVPLVYWIIKDIILFFGWLSVVSRMCSWDVTHGEHEVVYGDHSLQLLPATSTSRVVQPVFRDDTFYNGASHVLIHQDGLGRSSSNFVRPAIYDGGGYRGGGGGFGGGGAYGPSTYLYARN